MSNPYDEPNPYETPESGLGGAEAIRATVKGKVAAPAICLIVAACLGLGMSVFNVVYAMTAAPPPIDPNAPEFLQEFQKGQTGPVAVGIQMTFFFVNAFIIFGGVQMLRMRSWSLSLAAAILSIVNLGTCCCVLGLPFGIWSIVILSAADVKAAFAASADY